MRGRITEDHEALVEIAIRNGERNVSLDAVIDTGFTEFLMLPTSLLKAMGAVPEDESRVTLGDGRTALLDIFVVEVEWSGRWRAVRALASEGDALIGMKLLADHALSMRVVPDGEVRVEPL